jgi:PAS domain S-box-containing protein
MKTYLESRFAAVPGLAALAAGITVILSQPGRYGRLDPASGIGVLLLVVAGLAALLLGWLSSARIRFEAARRGRAEQALAESEQKYRDLVENAPVGIVVSSFDGRVLEVNETLVRMHGYDTKEEFVSSSVSHRFQDLKDRERWVAMVWGTGRADAFEVRSKRKDGSLFWSSLSSTFRKAADGEQELVTVVQDITERMNAVDALVYKTALLEAQTEAAPDGILVSDGDSRLILSNRRFREMWRIPAGMMESMDSEPVLLHASSLVEDPDSFMLKVRYLRSHRDEKSEDRICLRDGRIISRHTGPLVDAKGAYRGRVWYFRDITGPGKVPAEPEIDREPRGRPIQMD